MDTNSLPGNMASSTVRIACSVGPILRVFGSVTLPLKEYGGQMRDVLFGTRSALPGIQMAKGASEMLGGHLPELLILLVMLLVLIGAVWEWSGSLV
jgi:hypothetical protein